MEIPTAPSSSPSTLHSSPQTPFQTNLSSIKPAPIPKPIIHPSTLLPSAPFFFPVLVELTLAVAVVAPTCTSVVVKTSTIALTVVPGIVVPGIVLAASTCSEKLLDATTVCTVCPLAVVVVVKDTSIVSVIVEAGMIDGGRVEAGIVDPGRVVVYVIVISIPKLLAGTADPIPELVYCVGSTTVFIFGLAVGSLE
jgi:hypothetical protein